MVQMKALPGGRSALREWLKRSVALVAGMTIGALAAGSAVAQERPGPGMGGGPGMAMFAGRPEQMARHIDRMLDGLGATDAQRAQIKQIAVAAAADLKTQRDAGRSLRDRALQIFAAPSIDAAAAESLRKQVMAQREQASQRMLQAVLDAARVLTPEQRAKIGERMREHRSIMMERLQRLQHDPMEHGPRPPGPPPK